MKCCSVGEYSKELRTTIFPQMNANSRTDHDFRNKLYGKHHQDYKIRKDRKIVKIPIETPFLKLPIDMIQDFIVSDSLHLLHLGVMKKLLLIYRDGHSNHVKWPAETIKCISDFLTRVKLPMEIHRSVRGIDHITHWKGSEFGSFLNYIGIVVLRPFLNEEHYTNFVRLFCATVICSTDYYQRFLPVAKVLFNDFVTKYYELFGSVTSNIHNLLHVVEEVESKGSLPSISTYPFENHLYQVKKLVRSGRLPLSQIINRMTERDCNYSIISSVSQTFPLFKEPSKIDESKYLKISLNAHCTLRSNFADKWFLTEKQEIVAMDFANAEGIFGKEMVSPKTHLFDGPLDSVCMHIFKTNDKLTFKNQQLYSIGSVLCKFVVVTSAKETIFVPLVHTLPSDTKL